MIIKNVEKYNGNQSCENKKRTKKNMDTTKTTSKDFSFILLRFYIEERVREKEREKERTKAVSLKTVLYVLYVF